MLKNTTFQVNSEVNIIIINRFSIEHKLRSLDGDALARVEVLADEQKNQVEAPKA